MKQFDGTTVLCVRKNNQVAIGGDGQVSFGNTILKSNAIKIRKLSNNKVIAGFAGGSADAFALFELFEGKLEAYDGHIVKAAIKLAKDWRNNKILRKLEAILAVADIKTSLIITGNGDVIEPENNIIAIGSGGAYAQAAAYALINNTELTAKDIVEKSLKIAGDICIYTNNKINIETLE